MGEQVPGLSNIRTDRVSRVVPKKRRQEPGKEQFNSHLAPPGQDKESSSSHQDPDEHADPRPDDATPAILRNPKRSKRMDYLA